MHEVPHELDALLGVFVNRGTESAVVYGQLRDAAAGASVTVCSGLPGIGKTSLVLKVANEFTGRFPDGELFLDFGDGERSVEDLVGSALIRLGVAEQVLPARLSDRIRMLRTKIAGRAMLMVLDGVVEPGHVKPFIPNGKGSAVVVTSNRRLTELRLDGARLVELPPLDEQASIELLTAMCGARVAKDPEAMAMLVRECAGLPAALRLAAHRLLMSSALTVRELVRLIEQEGGGLGGLYDVSYQVLPADAARLYRQLGALPVASFTVELLAAATADADVAVSLATLVESGLVTDQGGRFTVHSLVRRHAAERAAAEDPDPNPVVRGMVEFVAARAAAADLAVLGAGRYRVPGARRCEDPNPFGDKMAALDWLVAERAALLAGIRAAARHGWYDLAWQLAESATTLYLSRRYLMDWTESSELGATAAEAVGNLAAQARLRSFASRAWTDLGQLDRAKSELDTGFALARQCSDTRLLASIWELYGRFFDASGEPEQAARAYATAVRLFSTVDDRRGVAFVSYFLGCSQHLAGDPESALTTLRTALPLVREQGESRMLGRTLIGIAAALGDTDEARTTLEEAIVLLRDDKELVYEAKAQEMLAELDPLRAKDCVRRVHDIQEELGLSD